MPPAALAADVAVNLWDLVPAVIGGVIGALAGGLPPLMMARKDRKEKERASAFSTYVKLQTLANGILTFSLHLNEMLDRAKLSGNDRMALWQKIQPMLGINDGAAITFDPTEIAVLVAAGDAAFANDLMLLERR
jgi:energy-converting hydrogenase Eha subunit A